MPLIFLIHSSYERSARFGPTIRFDFRPHCEAVSVLSIHGRPAALIRLPTLVVGQTLLLAVVRALRATSVSCANRAKGDLHRDCSRANHRSGGASIGLWGGPGLAEGAAVSKTNRIVRRATRTLVMDGRC